MRLAGLITCGVICAAANSAQADWQYTKWGMTPEQTILASGGQLRAATPEETRGKSLKGYLALVVGAYSSGPFSFNGSFQFRNGILELVNLTLADYGRRNEVIDAIQARYGSPIENSHDRVGMVIKWRDEIGKNVVELDDIPSIHAANLIYSSMTPTGSGGL